MCLLCDNLESTDASHVSSTIGSLDDTELASCIEKLQRQVKTWEKLKPIMSEPSEDAILYVRSILTDLITELLTRHRKHKSNH